MMPYAEIVIRSRFRIRRSPILKRSHMRAAARCADYQAKNCDVIAVWIEAWPSGRKIYTAKRNRLHYVEPKPRRDEDE